MTQHKIVYFQFPDTGRHWAAFDFFLPCFGTGETPEDAAMDLIESLLNDGGMDWSMRNHTNISRVNVEDWSVRVRDKFSEFLNAATIKRNEIENPKILEKYEYKIRVSETLVGMDAIEIAEMEAGWEPEGARTFVRGGWVRIFAREVSSK